MHTVILALWYLSCVLLMPAWAAGTPPPDKAEEVNYCHDQANWQQWQESLAKYPEDMGMQMLHALWLGLCLKVEQRDLTIAQATAIFEDARTALILHRREEKKAAPKQGL